MMLTSLRELTLWEKLAALLLLAYPTAMLAVRGGMNTVFAITLLLALIVWAKRPAGWAAVAWHKEWNAYLYAMTGLSVAMLISQVAWQDFNAHAHDAPSRFWLGIPVFLLLLRVNPRVFVVLQYAFPLAAIVGLLMARDLGVGRWGIGTVDLIHFGDFEMVLAALSLSCIDWFGKDALPLRSLKLLGMVAGVLASFISGSRGGWLAIPVFALLLHYFHKDKLNPRWLWGGLAAGVMTVVLAYASSSTLQQRMAEMRDDLATYSTGNIDSDTGIRIQLYRAAWDIITGHPLLGVGPLGYAKEMQSMQEHGKVSAVAAMYGRGEVHSDILAKTAGMGVLGFIAILAIYLVPFRLFWQSAKSVAMQSRHAGIMGCLFVSGFFIFGLTAETFSLTMATAFYSFTVAVLLAACYNTPRE